MNVVHQALWAREYAKVLCTFLIQIYYFWVFLSNIYPSIAFLPKVAQAAGVNYTVYYTDDLSPGVEP